MSRNRFIILAVVLLVIVVGTACALVAIGGNEPAEVVTVTTLPTLHPTFTPTTILPSPTPLPPTPIPPQAEPTQTPVSQPVDEEQEATPTPVTQPQEEPTQTATLQPAEEPTATVEVSTPTPQVPQVEVIAATVNMRSGPGTNYSRAGQASQGQIFEVFARNNAGNWLQIKQANGNSAWIINGQGLTKPIGEIMGVTVAQNIPTPPPTAKPAPTQPPVPTNTPAPSFTFVKRSISERINSNAIVSFFGGLYNRSLDLANPVSGYLMVVISPNGERQETTFGNKFLHGDPGIKSSEFLYNAKLELPLVPGVFRAYVADAGGAQVSEVWEVTVSGETRTFIPRWVEK